MAYETSMKGGIKWQTQWMANQFNGPRHRGHSTPRPLRVFIMKSILSFIICISATTWGGVVSAAYGWLVSCRFGLLGALLPSSPSYSLLSARVPSWSFSWVFGPTFFWHSCSSRSWFCLVRRSIAAARVWTYLTRAMVRGSSLWTLLVVVIEWVSIMHLFV